MQPEGRFPLLIAVAGTHGKSLSGSLLAHLLKGAKTPGEGEFMDNLSREKFLNRIQALHSSPENRWAGLEITPRGLLQNAYHGLSFHLAVLTNLCPQSQGQIHHPRYLALHRNLLAQMAGDGIAVVNADDPKALETLDVAGGKPVTYALQYPGAMVTAEDYQPFPMGSSFSLTIRNEIPRLGPWHRDISSFSVRVPLPGEVGVYTALAAAASALALGIKEEEIARGLKTFPGLKRRLEYLTAGSIQIVDDILPSPLALVYLLNSLAPLRFQRMFLVLGVEKGEKEKLSRLALALLEQEAKHPLAEIFLTSCGEELPASRKASQTEEKAFLDTWQQGKGRASVALFQGLAPALQELSLSLKKGDLVLLLGGRGMNRAGKMISSLLREEGEIRNMPEQKENLSDYRGFLNPS